MVVLIGFAIVRPTMFGRKTGSITIAATSIVDDLRNAIPLANPGMVWDLLVKQTPDGPPLDEELPLSSVFGPVDNTSSRRVYVEMRLEEEAGSMHRRGV